MTGHNPTGTPPTQGGDERPTFDWWNMPDLCTTCSDRHGDDAIHFPHTFRNGTAHYQCTRGHRWTCGWAAGPDGTRA